MINDKIFKELAQTENQTCVSVYISTHRAGQRDKDRITLKNALKEAHNKLLRINKSEREADAFLARAYELQENDDFLNNLSDTLAIFITDGQFRYFTLPIQTQNYTFVGNEFYVLPLLKELNNKERFFILALSQNEVRFFEGRSTVIYPVKIEDLVPADRAEALKYYDNPETKLQHHNNGKATVFHGQGGGKDVENARLKEYFRAIDSGLMEMLHDEKAPLIIAAVDYLVPIYREISDYKNIADVHISGNPESMTPTDLHHTALEKLEPHFSLAYREVIEDYRQNLSDDKAESTLINIIPAAINERVSTLLVREDSKFYGTVNAQLSQVEFADEMTSDNLELVNTAAKHTYLNGGEVYIMDSKEMPDKTSPVCAIYRYETVEA